MQHGIRINLWNVGVEHASTHIADPGGGGGFGCRPGSNLRSISYGGRRRERHGRDPIRDGGQFTAVHFDFESDASLSATAALGPAASAASKTLTTADLGSGKQCLLIAGLNQTAIGDGALVTLSLSVPAGAGGQQFPLRLYNAGAANTDGKSVPVATTNGVLVVGTPLAKIDAVVNGASFSPVIVDGSWVTILGSNLAATSRPWQASDFVGANLPISLDAVSVMIDGQPAAAYYVSPAQSATIWLPISPIANPSPFFDSVRIPLLVLPTSQWIACRDR